MDLLKRSLARFSPPRLPGRVLAAGMVCLLLILSLIPVADTLWAETLTVSGEAQTGSFEQTPTETATPTPTVTPTSTAQAGTSLEAYKTAQTRWKEDAAGQFFFVFGEICVRNGGDVATAGLTLFDQIEIKPRRADWQPLPGANLLIVAEQQLPPGEVACFEYEIELPYLPETIYRNAALVTILNHSGWLPGGNHCPGEQPCPYGPRPRADIELPPLPPGASLPEPPGAALIPPTPSPTPAFSATIPASPPPTATPLPPDPTDSPPPTSTPLPPDPTDTPPPTATPLPPDPTDTPPPTGTPLPPDPTDTPPPTGTPLPPDPTDTPPPTSTPLPPDPTDTPPPSDTPQPRPTGAPPLPNP